MQYEAIDHVILPVSDLEQAAAPFERLGLRLTPPYEASGWGFRNRLFSVGGGGTHFYVELFSLADAATMAARGPHGERLLSAFDHGPGLFAVSLRVASLEHALADLAGRGVVAEPVEGLDENGVKFLDVAFLPWEEAAAANILLVAYLQPARPAESREGRPAPSGPGLQLKRLDHLAAVAPDLEESTRYWSETLGVPLFGEVVSPTTIIRQFKIGDAILELLGPATPDSPLRSRTAGLASMTAFEVPDLGVAVAQARAAGFNPPDPAPGPLPGTRVSTIPAAELSGLALQLLEYI